MLPFHPYADLFPLIEGEQFAELVTDLKVNDLREKIVVWDGAILDGRNRYRAALAAGLIEDDDEPDRAKYFTRFVPAVDGDALKYVISKNLHRRHLNESQRAMVAARLSNLPAHRPDKSANLPTSQPDAAASLNVSPRSVRSAVAVRDKGSPELQHAVDQGRLSVSQAAIAARLSPAQQSKVVARAEAGDERAARTVIKQETRAAREKELGDKQHALPDVKAGLILEDYEWDDTVWSRETGMDRHAGNHYPTSETAHTAEEIHARRPIESIVDTNCVLAMWTTNQHLAIAIKLMELRRFDYKSNYAWGKNVISTGRWNRSKHELLLLGTRGSPPCPAPGTQWDSLLFADKSEHSAKPDLFYEMFEAYFPTLIKIELNARRARPGWVQWGNQSVSAKTDETKVTA